MVKPAGEKHAAKMAAWRGGIEYGEKIISYQSNHQWRREIASSAKIAHQRHGIAA